MFLTDKKIEECICDGKLSIFPFSEENIRHASYLFTLDTFLKKQNGTEINLDKGGFILKPGEFILGRTVEKVSLKNNFVCFLSTKSSIAQEGVDVLQTSIFVEPNTNNQIILEISNHGLYPFKLLPGTKIVKGVFAAIS